MKKQITIEGMGCMMCVKRVTKILEGLEATDIQCEIGKAVAEFSCDDATIKAAVEKGGYTVVSMDKAE